MTRNKWLLFFACFYCLQAAAQNLIIKPKEIRDVFINPGIGFTTFHHFNSDHHPDGPSDPQEIADPLREPNGDLRYAKYPPASIAYFRWYWDVIEPEEGKYNWELIDETIAQAEANHQKLAFRIMPQNGVPKAPEWYRKIAKGFTYENGRSWMPDYDDPLYWKYMGALIRTLGERYDGHPGVDHVDMGVVGRWGEWHTSGTGHPMPSMEIQKAFVDLYLQAFHRTPLVMLIGGDEAMRHAIQRGTGWRADCLGDMGGFSKNWNHMEDAYPISIAEAEAVETWQHAPVVFESCWTMQEWLKNQWDVKEIFERALQYHASVFNNKSSEIPEELWPDTNDFLRRVGYRYVLRRVFLNEESDQGTILPMQVLWENVGVAPCYASYRLVYEFKCGESVFRHTSVEDLREWLPGYRLTNETVMIPSSLSPGRYDLRVAVLLPDADQPALRLAIAGREEDGWYNLGSITIR